VFGDDAAVISQAMGGPAANRNFEFVFQTEISPRGAEEAELADAGSAANGEYKDVAPSTPAVVLRKSRLEFRPVFFMCVAVRLTHSLPEQACWLLKAPFSRSPRLWDQLNGWREFTNSRTAA
jgi:hypothetical protein